MLVNYNGETFILKFKYLTETIEKERKYKKREGLYIHEHKYTLAMYRNIKHSHQDYVMVRVDCHDGDAFNKVIGRELAFKKLLKLAIHDDGMKMTFIDAYNKHCTKNPIQEGGLSE